jgi:hypothetical protein
MCAVPTPDSSGPRWLQAGSERMLVAHLQQEPCSRSPRYRRRPACATRRTHTRASAHAPAHQAASESSRVLPQPVAALSGREREQRGGAPARRGRGCQLVLLVQLPAHAQRQRQRGVQADEELRARRAARPAAHQHAAGRAGPQRVARREQRRRARARLPALARAGARARVFAVSWRGGAGLDQREAATGGYPCISARARRGAHQEPPALLAADVELRARASQMRTSGPQAYAHARWYTKSGPGPTWSRELGRRLLVEEVVQAPGPIGSRRRGAALPQQLVCLRQPAPLTAWSKPAAAPGRPAPCLHPGRAAASAPRTSASEMPGAGRISTTGRLSNVRNERT